MSWKAIIGNLVWPLVSETPSTSYLLIDFVKIIFLLNTFCFLNTHQGSQSLSLPTPFFHPLELIKIVDMPKIINFLSLFLRKTYKTYAFFKYEEQNFYISLTLEKFMFLEIF